MIKVANYKTPLVMIGGVGAVVVVVRKGKEDPGGMGNAAITLSARGMRVLVARVNGEPSDYFLQEWLPGVAESVCLVVKSGREEVVERLVRAGYKAELLEWIQKGEGEGEGEAKGEGDGV